MRARGLVLGGVVAACAIVLWSTAIGGASSARGTSDPSDERSTSVMSRMRSLLGFADESETSSSDSTHEDDRGPAGSQRDGQGPSSDSSATPGRRPGYVPSEETLRLHEARKREQEIVPPTEKEEAVLTMYDAVADAFEAHPDDCQAMASAVSSIVREHGGAVRAVVAEQAGFDDAQLLAARERLEKSSGKRMESARNAMRNGLARCSQTAELQASLQELAAMNVR